MKAETVASKMIHWANAAERLLNDLNSPDEMKNRRGNFFFLCRERLEVVTGSVQGVPGRRLTACKYM